MFKERARLIQLTLNRLITIIYDKGNDETALYRNNDIVSVLLIAGCDSANPVALKIHNLLLHF